MKKLTEFAFNVRFRFQHALNTDEALDFMNRLHAEVFDPNELMMNGGGDEVWQIAVASLRSGHSPGENHRAIVLEWLQQHPLVRMTHVGELRQSSDAEVAFHEDARRSLLGLDDDDDDDEVTDT